MVSASGRGFDSRRLHHFSFDSLSLSGGPHFILIAMKKVVIAIDGPAASGKSTTAKRLAERLGVLPIDTGAMYRAVTLVTLEAGIDPHDQKKVEEIAQHLEIQQVFENGEVRTFVNGQDRSRDLRTPEINRWVSLVSSYPGVRRSLVEKQRAMAKRGGVVLEGRDIGTVVLPDADLKIFMVASPEERARRRWKELQEAGMEIPFEEVLQEILRRDHLDSTRADSPLKKAEDAVVLDTTNLTIQEQVEAILELLKKRGLDP